MAYRIEYFKEGEKLGWLVGWDDLPRTMRVVAKVGADLDVDFVRVLDEDGIEVCSERFDA